MAKVESFMNHGVLRVDHLEKISVAIGHLQRDANSCVIVEEKGKPIGIISATDAVRFLADAKKNQNQRV